MLIDMYYTADLDDSTLRGTSCSALGSVLNLEDRLNPISYNFI
jgi:hypothetical protein